jgi:hypothetical protein
MAAEKTRAVSLQKTYAEHGAGHTDRHGDGRQEGRAELVPPGIPADVGHGHIGAEAKEDAKRRPELPPAAVLKGRVRVSEGCGRDKEGARADARHDESTTDILLPACTSEISKGLLKSSERKFEPGTHGRDVLGSIDWVVEALGPMPIPRRRRVMKSCCHV